MRKILITGGTGHLGKAVIGHLLKNTGADNIIALARDIKKADFLTEKGIEVRIGNFDDTASLDNAMQGITKVLLISGLEAHRLQQHKNVVDAAKKAGVKHIAYTGVSFRDINASAIKGYMEPHFLTEDYIKESGLTYTFLRNSLYADAIPLFAGEKAKETGIFLPAGNGKVPFALRKEMGEATANILLQNGHENKTYQITGSELYSFEDIARELGTNYTDADTATFPDELRKFGVPEKGIFIVSGFAADMKNYQYETESNDLENLLDRKPTSLKESLKAIYG